MAQEEETEGISFRIPAELAERVANAGLQLPRMAGQRPPSVHQSARAFMILGLEAYLEVVEEDK